MRPIFKNLLITSVCSLALGALANVPVINSANSYVASYPFLLLLILIGIVAVVLFITGLITISESIGPLFLLSAILLPTGFFGGAFIAKALELGAYCGEPMISFPPPVANKVLFKKGATDEEIARFWSHIIGYPTGENSSWTRPGIESAARTPAENGHEVVTFSYRPNATEEQRADIRVRINSYPPVFQYLENVTTAIPIPSPSPLVRPNVKMKKIIPKSTNTSE